MVSGLVVLGFGFRVCSFGVPGSIYESLGTSIGNHEENLKGSHSAT